MRESSECGGPTPGALLAAHEQRRCLLQQPGRLCYADALRLQLDLHSAVVRGDVPGVLVLLEHEPVITMGVKTVESNVLVDPRELERRGIELVKTDRGGDVTYHGPGQIVGYPILRLRELGMDVHGFLRALEQSVIDALAEFDLVGARRGQAGVWVGDKKVCSVGIAVRKGVTYHGFALNVDPDMSRFALINPCGLPHSSLSSIKLLLGEAPDMMEVRSACARAFAENFAVELDSWSDAR